MGQAIEQLPVLQRGSGFSYTCGQCSRCCYGKRIPLNPYELIRLAHARDCTTTELIGRFTDGGTLLAIRDVPGEPCVFLGDRGCTVHSGRPLACRLYPLGRIVDHDGNEWFLEVEPHPRTAGVYGSDGTIDAYLQLQEVAPYLAAADAYYALFQRVQQLLTNTSATESPLLETVDDFDLIDADAVIVANGHTVPADPDERARLHLVLLNAWLDQFSLHPTEPPCTESSVSP